MLHKSQVIKFTNPYLALSNDKQYSAQWTNMDIMKCLMSKDIIASYQETHIIYKEVRIEH